MAAFVSESNLQPDALSSANPSGSPFNIPSFFIRFSTKTSPDNDSAKSPTSPLDLVLSSFKNPFGFRCQKSSSSRTGSKRILHCTKVGLGIINSLADETQVIGEVLDAPEMKNILFRPQVKKKKTDSSSNVDGNGGLEGFCSESKAVMSLPILVQNSLVTKPSSLPVTTNGTTLSAREIELSEDYTCVTCHGPNPKTTHIFGDCILECHTKEGENISIHRGKNPFCSLECGSEEMFAEEETEQSFDSSHEQEDLFLMSFHASST